MAIATLRAVADPIAVVAGVQPFTPWQQVFDSLPHVGGRFSGRATPTARSL